MGFLIWILGIIIAYAIMTRLMIVICEGEDCNNDYDDNDSNDWFDNECRRIALTFAILGSWILVAIGGVILIILYARRFLKKRQIKENMEKAFITFFDKKIVPFLKKLEQKE